MSDTKNAVVETSAPIATPKTASWANWVVGVQGPLLGLILLCVIFTLTTNVFFSLRNALNYDRIGNRGWLSPGGIRSFAGEAIKRLGVKGTPQQLARHLSGGNQQKVIIARWISRVPKGFILDEPTRGIDMGALAAIYETIAGLARGGMGVIVFSSDLDEVLCLPPRIVTLTPSHHHPFLHPP